MKSNLRKIILIVIIAIPLFSLASTTVGTIDTTNKYAWSNQSGWVNFGATNGNVTVTDTAITGYAWLANHGWLNLAPTNSGVTNNSEGDLSGYAWNDQLGWINFANVSINSSGKFTGTAVDVNGGTINFDCTNCNVVTDWRPLSTRSSQSVVNLNVGNGPIFGLFGNLATSSNNQIYSPNTNTSPREQMTYPDGLPKYLPKTSNTSVKSNTLTNNVIDYIKGGAEDIIIVDGNINGEIATSTHEDTYTNTLSTSTNNISEEVGESAENNINDNYINKIVAFAKNNSVYIAGILLFLIIVFLLFRF